MRRTLVLGYSAVRLLFGFWNNGFFCSTLATGVKYVARHVTDRFPALAPTGRRKQHQQITTALPRQAA